MASCYSLKTSFVQEIEEEFLQEKLPELLEVSMVMTSVTLCYRNLIFYLHCSLLLLQKLIALGPSTVYALR